MALVQNLFSGKKGISSTTIKIIAVVTMLIDHIGAILITYYDNKIVNFILRLIGRIAFPLFAFCLAEGFAHTSSRKKYAIRLLVAAIISEPAYNLAFAQMNIDFLKQQNVLFTFFIAFCVLWVIENIKNKDGLKFKKPLIVLTTITGMLLSELIRAEYGCMGIVLVLVFYLLREKKLKLFIISSLTYFFGYVLNLYIYEIYHFWYAYKSYMYNYELKKDLITSEPQFKFNLESIINQMGFVSGDLWTYAVKSLLLGAIAAPAIIMIYNGKKGKAFPKLAFYIFYPAHLLLLWNLMQLIKYVNWIY